MNRKRLVLFIALGCVFAAAPASAQPEWLLSGAFGAHLPLGDYSEIADTGWDGGVQLDNRVRKDFGYGFDLFYSATSGEVLAADTDFSILQVGAHLTGYLGGRSGGPMLPYGQIALAYYNRKAEAAIAEETEGDVGLSFVGGLLYMPATSKIGFGADVSIHNVFHDDAAQYMGINGKIVVSFSDR